MNTIVARMLGEADHHSPEELAQLKGAGGHGETDMGNPEEAREVQIGKALKAAAGNPQEVLRLADELIMMHKAQMLRKQMSMMALPQSSSAPSSP